MCYYFGGVGMTQPHPYGMGKMIMISNVPNIWVQEDMCGCRGRESLE